MKQYWNKAEFLKAVEQKTGFRIAPITLWSWEKKGLFKPSGYLMNGKQKRPVYDENNLNRLIKRVNKAKENDSARIKLR